MLLLEFPYDYPQPNSIQFQSILLNQTKPLIIITITIEKDLTKLPPPSLISSYSSLLLLLLLPTYISPSTPDSISIVYHHQPQRSQMIWRVGFIISIM